MLSSWVPYTHRLSELPAAATAIVLKVIEKTMPILSEGADGPIRRSLGQTPDEIVEPDREAQMRALIERRADDRADAA